jgi:hypothetical protein
MCGALVRATQVRSKLMQIPLYVDESRHIKLLLMQILSLREEATCWALGPLTPIFQLRMLFYEFMLKVEGTLGVAPDFVRWATSSAGRPGIVAKATYTTEGPYFLKWGGLYEPDGRVSQPAG